MVIKGSVSWGNYRISFFFSIFFFFIYIYKLFLLSFLLLLLLLALITQNQSKNRTASTFLFPPSGRKVDQFNAVPSAVEPQVRVGKGMSIRGRERSEVDAGGNVSDGRVS